MLRWLFTPLSDAALAQLWRVAETVLGIACIAGFVLAVVHMLAVFAAGLACDDDTGE